MGVLGHGWGMEVNKGGHFTKKWGGLLWGSLKVNLSSKTKWFGGIADGFGFQAAFEGIKAA